MATKPRDYKREWQLASASEAKRQAHRDRDLARRTYDKKGIARTGMEIDHRVPLSKGGSSGTSNTRLLTPSNNKSFPRTKTGAVKTNKK